MDSLHVIQHYLNEHHAIPPEHVTAETRLEEINIDSLSFLGLVFEFESKLGISAPDKEITNIQTIGELISLVEKLTTEKK